MRPIQKAVVCGILAVVLEKPTGAQVSISTNESGKSRTYLLGSISMGADLPIVETSMFKCTPVLPLKKGDEIAAMTSVDGAWSVTSKPLQVGSKTVEYPVMATLKCSHGVHSVFLALMSLKSEIKAGQKTIADGYQIEAKRAVRVGDSISVLVIPQSPLFGIVAIEDTKESSKKGEAEPIFIAQKAEANPEDKAVLIEAWRLVREHVQN